MMGVNQKESIQNETENTASKRICVLAYEGFHAFILHAIVQIADFERNEVEVYTIASMKKELVDYLGADEEKIHWTIVSEADEGDEDRKEKNLELHLSISKEICKKDYLDMIILPSAEYEHEKYAPIFLNPPADCEVVAMVHNLNQIFCGQDNTPELCELFSHASSYAVLDGLLIEEVNQRGLTDKPVYELPVAYREDDFFKKKEKNKRVVFVMTGHVQKERKDFDLVLDVFEELSDYYDKVQLFLLGEAKTPYGKGIVRRCKKLRANGLAVAFFESYVPTSKFRAYMRKSDFILGAINVRFTKGYVDEVYNKTKVTGIITDMIEYAKPGIVPVDLQMPDKLATSTFHYSSALNLKRIIIALLDENVVQMYADEALKNSKKYLLNKYLL